MKRRGEQLILRVKNYDDLGFVGFSFIRYPARRLKVATLQRHLAVSLGSLAQPTTTLGRWRVASTCLFTSLTYGTVFDRDDRVGIHNLDKFRRRRK